MLYFECEKDDVTALPISYKNYLTGMNGLLPVWIWTQLEQERAPSVSVAILPDIILHYFDVALLPDVILHYFEGRDAVFEKYTRG